MFKHTLKPTACSGRKSARWVCKQIDRSTGWPPLPPRRRETVCGTQWGRSGRCHCTGPTGTARIYMKTQAVMSSKNLQKDLYCTNTITIICTRTGTYFLVWTSFGTKFLKIGHAVETEKHLKEMWFKLYPTFQIVTYVDFNIIFQLILWHCLGFMRQRRLECCSFRLKKYTYQRYGSKSSSVTNG